MPRKKKSLPPVERGAVAAAIVGHPREFVGIVLATAATAMIFANALFLPAGHFFDNIDVLASIPIHIVHGRFDEVCPLTQASRLVAGLRGVGAEPATYVVTNAGHSAMERENALALTAVMDGLDAIERQ